MMNCFRILLLWLLSVAIEVPPCYSFIPSLPTITKSLSQQEQARRGLPPRRLDDGSRNYQIGDILFGLYYNHNEQQPQKPMTTRLEMSFRKEQDTNDKKSSRRGDVASTEVTLFSSTKNNVNWTNITLFTMVGFLYWYWMVLGAAAKLNGLPFIPEFIPMIPGWPVSTEELQPAIEDSYHFFYLSDILQTNDAPYVIPPRLAIFNFVEAWIFATLPALWADNSQRRLPRPILLSSWLILGINLTNAFLAPYLLITEFRTPNNEINDGTTTTNGNNGDNKNKIVASVFGIIATVVVSYATYEWIFDTTTNDWNQFWNLVETDRTYLAFCLDPCLFAIFQPIILRRVRESKQGKEVDQALQQPVVDYIPFVGLISWLFESG